MSNHFDFDYFVIGAGSGGVRSARIAASLGARTAIAEARFYGGTCVNVGCIPKKLYTYAAHFSMEVADSAAFGWQSKGLPGFDWGTLKENKDTEIKRLNGIYGNLLKGAGVQIYDAFARLTAPGEVTLSTGEVFTARHILIAVGGRPYVPEIPGAELAMTSDDFFELRTQPREVVVVGGGYIATELAGVFHGLGSNVHLVHRRDTLLSGFDHDIQAFYTEAAQRDLTLHLSAEIQHIEPLPDERRRVTLSNGETIDCDAILFATGRKPATADMGLQELGVKLSDQGAVLVDPDFESSVPGIYAVGDVIDRVTLTPVALAEGQALANCLFGGKSRPVSYDNIPAAVFSHPQIATVGLTEIDARHRYQDVVVYKSRFRPLKYTLSKRDHFSFMKLIVDARTDRVVGLHMAGDDAAEIVQGMAVAIQAGATKADFDATIGIHPTAAEEFVTMRTPSPD